jgi:hypothetical protein
MLDRDIKNQRFLARKNSMYFLCIKLLIILLHLRNFQFQRDLGKKWFAFTKLDLPKDLLLDRLH